MFALTVGARSRDRGTVVSQLIDRPSLQSRAGRETGPQRWETGPQQDSRGANNKKALAVLLFPRQAALGDFFVARDAAGIALAGELGLKFIELIHYFKFARFTHPIHE